MLGEVVVRDRGAAELQHARRAVREDMDARDVMMTCEIGRDLVETVGLGIEDDDLGARRHVGHDLLVVGDA